MSSKSGDLGEVVPFEVGEAVSFLVSKLELESLKGLKVVLKLGSKEEAVSNLDVKRILNALSTTHLEDEVKSRPDSGRSSIEAELGSSGVVPRSVLSSEIG